MDSSNIVKAITGSADLSKPNSYFRLLSYFFNVATGYKEVAGNKVILYFIQSILMAGMQTRTLSGESFEGKGIPPDHTVDFDYSHMTSTPPIDDKLEYAIDWVEKHQ